MININTKIKTIEGTIKLLIEYEATIYYDYKKRRNVNDAIAFNRALLDDFEKVKKREAKQGELEL
jgi:hypothetical protein